MSDFGKPTTMGGNGVPGYDAVLMRDTAGHEKAYTRAEYEALPLGYRLSAITDGRVTYLLHGQVVSASAATRK